jgi:ADP-heptose:LPS heptosyltransferase
VNLRLKLLVDTLVGRPLVACLNLLAYPLGKILRRDHRLPERPVIIVCKLMGLGSIVQITPLLSALREAYPDAHIIFLTRRQNLAYCERIEAIDEPLGIEDRSPVRLFYSTAKVLARIWKLGADLFINLEVYSNLGALLTVTSCARNRLGYYMTPRDQRAWGIYTHMVYFNRAAQISEVYLQAARCLGIEVLDSALLAPRITAGEREALLARLSAMGVGPAPAVVVNPNSSELSRERCWPPAAFAAALVETHRRHPELQFLVIGGPGEEETGRYLLSHIPELSQFPVTDLTGRLSLAELIVLLDGASALLTNDSGPMHLAFSLSVPTVALFGPVSPEHYGGVDGVSRVLLYHRLYCSPCVHHFLEAPCRGDNQCMKLITVQQVVAALDAVLSGTAQPGREMPLRYIASDIVFGAHRRGGSSDLQ